MDFMEQNPPQNLKNPERDAQILMSTEEVGDYSQSYSAEDLTQEKQFIPLVSNEKPSPMEKTESLPLLEGNSYEKQDSQNSLYEREVPEIDNPTVKVGSFLAEPISVPVVPLTLQPNASRSPLKSPTAVIRRTSLDQLNEVVNDPHNHYIQNEFGMPGNKFTIHPTETNLEATYQWKVESEKLKSSDKIVSLPFGPSDWMWQIVLYPKGTEKSKEFAAYIRPIRNDTEISMKDWKREVSSYTIAIKRCTSNGNDYYVTKTTSQAKPFSEENPGRGFYGLCPLPLDWEQIEDKHGLVSVEVQVSGPVISTSGTMEFIDHVNIQDLHHGIPIYSRQFGPDSRAWQIELAPVVESNGSVDYISAFLKPVISESECHEVFRIICSFTLRLHDPIKGNLLCTKTLTGSTMVNCSENIAGFPKFMEKSLLHSLKSVVAEISVTWDPTLFSDYTQLGKMNSSLLASISHQKLLEQELAQTQYDRDVFYNEKLQLENALQFSYESENLKNQGLLEELEHMRERVKMLTSELNELRLVQNASQMVQVKLAQTKERLARLQLWIQQDNLTSTLTSDSDLESQLMNSRNEYATLFHQKAELELQLAQCRSELQFVNRSSRDNLLLSAIPRYSQDHEIDNLDELSPQQRLQRAVESAKSEIEVGKTAIEEINKRFASEFTSRDQAGLVADISVVQCGLDVASATLAQIPEDLIFQTQDYADTKYQLDSIRHDLLRIRLDLESATLNFKILDHHVNQEVPFTGETGNTHSLSKNTEFSEVHFREKIESLAEIYQSKLSAMSKVEQIRDDDEADYWIKPGLVESHELKQLTSAVRDLTKKQKVKLFSWDVFVFYLLVFFSLYVTKFFLCNPTDPYSKIADGQFCRSIFIPTVDTVTSSWHNGADMIMKQVFSPGRGMVITNWQKLLTFTEKSLLEKPLKFHSKAQASAEANIHPLDHNVPKTEPVVFSANSENLTHEWDPVHMVTSIMSGAVPNTVQEKSVAAESSKESKDTIASQVTLIANAGADEIQAEKLNVDIADIKVEEKLALVDGTKNVDKISQIPAATVDIPMQIPTEAPKVQEQAPLLNEIKLDNDVSADEPDLVVPLVPISENAGNIQTKIEEPLAQIDESEHIDKKSQISVDNIDISKQTSTKSAKFQQEAPRLDEIKFDIDFAAIEPDIMVPKQPIPTTEEKEVLVTKALESKDSVLAMGKPGFPIMPNILENFSESKHTAAELSNKESPAVLATQEVSTADALENPIAVEQVANFDDFFGNTIEQPVKIQPEVNEGKLLPTVSPDMAVREGSSQEALEPSNNPPVEGMLTVLI